MITAGPTREHWDPIRFMSNGSSGQMGISLALEAARLGAEVTLVLGPVPGSVPRRRKTLRVFRDVSAREMDQKVKAFLPGTSVIVWSAAVDVFRHEIYH